MLCTDCSKVIYPVIGLDIDGTLADYHEDFTAFAERFYARRLRHHYDGSCGFAEFMGLTDDQYRAAKLAYRQGGGKRMMPVVAGAGQLAEYAFNESELWITTTRPYNRFDSTDPDTREWLRRNFIPSHHLLYDDDKYLRLVQIVGAQRVACIVDDLPENVNRAAELGLHAVIVSRPYNTRARLHRSVVRVPDLFAARAAVEAAVKEWGN